MVTKEIIGYLAVALNAYLQLAGLVFPRLGYLNNKKRRFYSERLHKTILTATVL